MQYVKAAALPICSWTCLSGMRRRFSSGGDSISRRGFNREAGVRPLALHTICNIPHRYALVENSSKSLFPHVMRINTRISR